MDPSLQAPLHRPAQVSRRLVVGIAATLILGLIVFCFMLSDYRAVSASVAILFRNESEPDALALEVSEDDGVWAMQRMANKQFDASPSVQKLTQRIAEDTANNASQRTLSSWIASGRASRLVQGDGLKVLKVIEKPSGEKLLKVEVVSGHRKGHKGFVFEDQARGTFVRSATEQVTPKAISAQDQPAPGHERAVFGGGSFWCIEAIFERLAGVNEVTCGYAGGETENPSYAEVCTHTTGHAEVVLIDFDPEKISYEKLLHVFWRAHNPTQLNRQGNDVGDSYRTTILTLNDEQKAIAEKSKTAEQKNWPEPIVTKIEPLTTFYTAEVSHQDYYRINKDRNPYCKTNIRPKIEELESEGTIPKM